MSGAWRRCSACKSEIRFRELYYVCSVSTCKQKKTDYAFCSLDCWDQHLPIERHREDSASAIEKKAPEPPERESRRVVVSQAGARAQSFERASAVPEPEILVVASRLKKYISDRARMNTGASALDALSDRVRQIADRAIESARADGRKTVLDRDIPKI